MRAQDVGIVDIGRTRYFNFSAQVIDYQWIRGGARFLLSLANALLNHHLNGTNMLNSIRKGLLASVVGIGLLAGNSHALVQVPTTSYSGLVVFGDSLSDSGNNSQVFGNDSAQVINDNTYIPGQTYASGTYSNGPVWASQFAAMLGLSLAPSLSGGSNYAYGGAVTNPDQTYAFPGGTVTLPSLVSQAGKYLATNPGNLSSTLFVVAGGGNNARSILGAYGSAPDPAALVATQASQFATDIGDIVDALQANGAQHIIVWDTPNIGLLPAVLAQGAGASFLGSSIAGAMNNALTLRLNGEAGVQMFDLFGLIQRATSSGLFDNLVDACGNPNKGCHASLGTSLFYDGIHPTTAAHSFIAGEMQVLAAVPEPTEVAMLLTGLLVLGGMARRKRLSA